MEVDAVIEMFQRSEITAENKEVFKKECINHIQKRMGTHLRNVKKNTKGFGGKGKLTGKLMDELSIYYGLAIRRNHDSVQKMRDAISKMMSMIPKSVSSGKIVLDTVANLAVCTYNDGMSSIMQIMKLLGLTIGHNYYNYCLETDACRIKFSEFSLSDAAKEARTSLKSARKDAEHEDFDMEGEIYGAGIAD
nr:PREDICTED: uncharacterized protein LOC105669009 isoform X2 [Linepithema humile]